MPKLPKELASPLRSPIQISSPNIGIEQISHAISFWLSSSTKNGQLINIDRFGLTHKLLQGYPYKRKI